MTRLAALIVIGLSALAAAGCSSMQTVAPMADVHSAICVLQPTKGNNVHGTVEFTDVTGGVKVIADVDGLAPNSKHGFHIHQYGNIDCDDGTCTGGHYDPDHTEHHAMPDAPEPHHAGDMGNITADGSGHAHYEAIIHNITVAGAHNPIVGRAVIVHAKPDDGGQPTGNAGARMAYGVIGIAKGD